MNKWQRAPAFTYLSKIDWKLLLFLILLLNVKIIVKLIALLLVFLWLRKAKTRLHFKRGRFPLFYPLLIIWALIGALLQGSFSQPDYIYVFSYGTAVWLLCLLYFGALRTFTDTNTTARIYYTLIVFFVLNAFFSCSTLVQIMLETGALNPYRYQGDYQKYFISTGDYIKGISFDTSTTNAALNALGVVFFLRKQNYAMTFLCMIVLLLTCSNTINIILFATLAVSFFTLSANQRSVSIACFFLLVIFLARITPQNNDYAANVAAIYFANKPPTGETQSSSGTKPQVTPTDDSTKYQIAVAYLDSLSRSIALQTPVVEKQTVPVTSSQRITIPGDSIHTARYQHRDDTNSLRSNLLRFIALHPVETSAFSRKLPGKLTAFNETVKCLKTHPSLLATGAGMGNFSSKLAFKATGLNIAGAYFFPAYINPLFLSNHLNIFLYYFSRRSGLHSLVNAPNSVFNQLAGEYGVIGVILFILFYLGFFAKDWRSLTYGIPMLLLLTGFFFIDYWYEQLSIVPFFELLLLFNKKEMRGGYL
jgi:hypothetical protein